MPTDLDISALSLMDALDMATLIEVEAYERYKMFAAQFGRRGGFDPGAFFLTMAENEAKHGKELSARRKALFGDTPAKVALSQLYDVEAPSMGAPRRGMSTLQAFELALEAELEAYDFYDEALPGVTDPEVKALFVELRDEETENVEMLRRQMADLPPSAAFEDEIDHDESPFL